MIGHGPGTGQAPDQANEGGHAGAGSTREMSLVRHASKRPGTLRVTRRHQAPNRQDPPANAADTCKPILTRHVNGTTVLAASVWPAGLRDGALQRAASIVGSVIEGTFAVASLRNCVARPKVSPMVRPAS